MSTTFSKPSPGKLRVDLGSGAWVMRKKRKKRRFRARSEQLTPAQRDLAARFLPMARGMAKPLKLLYPFWRDEFESASCMALVEAARSYDPSQCTRFATFARFRIRGALMDVGDMMVLAGWDDAENVPGIVALTPYHEEHGQVLVATEPPPVGADVDDIDEVEQWLRKLPAKHAQVCRLYYAYGKTQAEIAVMFGCSQSEITRLHKKSLDLLAEPYGNRPIHRVNAPPQPTNRLLHEPNRSPKAFD